MKQATTATNDAIQICSRTPSKHGSRSSQAGTDCVVTAMPWLRVTMNPRPCRLRIPLPLRLLCQVQAMLTREANSDVEIENQELHPAKKSHPSTPSSPHPRTLRPRISWSTRGSAFSSHPQKKAPPTRQSRWDCSTGSKGPSPAQLAAERRRRVRPAGISGSGEAGAAAFSATGWGATFSTTAVAAAARTGAGVAEPERPLL